MRYLKKVRISLLILSMLAALIPQTVFAAEEEYTYTVRLYAGNQGILTGEGIEVPSHAKIVYGDEKIVISGLNYGDIVYIVYQDAVNVTDERYYARGVRRSGRDNSEATASSFTVASDRDYVIAYGVKGDMVSYTVNYLDESGNRLLASDTYYGAAGERQYVSARYVDGYQPQALNLVKTLSVNEAENVFDFQYTRVRTGVTAGEGGAGTGQGTGTAGGTGTTGTGAGTTGTDGIGGAAGGAADGGAGAGIPAPGGAAAGADTTGAGADAAGAGAQTEGGDVVGGDLTAVPDEDVPQNLLDLDDEDIPLENTKLQQSSGTVLGYLPIYASIALVAIAALVVMAVYLRKRNSLFSKLIKTKNKKSAESADGEK